MTRQQKKETYVSDREAQYDERAKRVAGSKIVIASILSKTVDAFRGMKPREIVPYIEGEPYIGSVPVEPGKPMLLIPKTGSGLWASIRKIRKKTKDW